MPCTYCGHPDIVYDFELGYTVCPSCGSVLEAIFIEHYEEHLPNQGFERYLGLPSIRKGLERKRELIKKSMLSRISKDVITYEKYAKRARKNVYVDLEAVLKRVNGYTTTRVYRHRDEEKALMALSQDPIAKLIMEKVIDRDPVLASRTLRGKIALALIIKSLISSTSSSVNLNEVCTKVSMSLVHGRRLLSLAKKRLPYIRRLALEVIQGVSTNAMPSKQG